MSDASIQSGEGARDNLQRLTGAECRVLYWLCQGLEVPEVAEKLVVTKSDVRGHLTNIYGKFGLHRTSSTTLRKYMLYIVYCPLH